MKRLEMKYFVLNPKSKIPGDIFAKASRKAMRAYAEIVRFEAPILANQLKEWTKVESLEDQESLGITKED